MTLRVRFDPAALDELHIADEWYERASPGLGTEFLAEVWDVIDRVATWSAAPGPIHIPSASTGVRRAALRRFSYGIVYVVVDDVLWIVAVAHNRRRPGYWQGRVDE